MECRSSLILLFNNRKLQDRGSWEVTTSVPTVPTTNPSPKRKRGVILTIQGWQRLQAAKRRLEIQENSGNPYTLEELSARTNLSPNTIVKIQRRQIAVDRHSLESYFSAFHLTLSPSDHTKFDSDKTDSRTRTPRPSRPPTSPSC